MKMLRMVLGLLAAAQVGCASTKSSVLKPSALDATLSDLDADAANPFAKPATQVEVLEVGIPEYDRFFRDAAQVQGSVILSDLLVKQLDPCAKDAAAAVVPDGDAQKAAGDTALRAATTRRPLTDAQKAELRRQLDRVKLAGALLADVPKRAAALVGTGKELLGGMQRAFSGANALKAPAVTQGLHHALDQLQDASDRAPKLADTMQAAVKASVAVLDGKPATAPLAPKGKKQKKTASAAGKKVTRS